MNTGLAQSTLISTLLDPTRALALSPGEWNELLTQARRCFLLARLGIVLDEGGLMARVPAKARDHIFAARVGADSSQTAVRFEVNRVRRALADTDIPIVLLKGAAYLIAGLPPAPGRHVGDLDLMVPRHSISRVEQTLVEHGWVQAKLDPYDERYYREWTHEIPPLQHPERQTPLDVHHTITQLTSRTHPDAAALLAASVAIPGSCFRVLAPADMVLHSAVHLFNDEVGKPLRDLLDLHGLMSHFGAQEEFWVALIERARLHGLGRPIYYAVRYAARLFRTPVPASASLAIAQWAPARATRSVMDWLFLQYFIPEPLERRRPGAALARGLLYLRVHWLRMPPLLLARHLSIKAWRRTRARFEKKPEAA